MSMSFEVFPTKKVVPKSSDIIRYSASLFSDFMCEKSIVYNMEVTVREGSSINEVSDIPTTLTLRQDHCTVFNINKEGEIYVFYHELTMLDKEFWDIELQENENAQMLKEKINANLEIGYFWSIKRTMGQPAIASLYYGYLAIAIATLTDGIIYSDDGAWDYSLMPVDGTAFKDIYLDIDKIHDTRVRENIEMWLEIFKTNT